MLESYDANDITIIIKNDFQNAVVPRPLCLYLKRKCSHAHAWLCSFSTKFSTAFLAIMESPLCEDSLN